MPLLTKIRIEILWQRERILHMADRRKNEQYDIVSEAEKILADYIKRCFSLGKLKERRDKKKKMMAFFVTGICVLVFAVYVYLSFV